MFKGETFRIYQEALAGCSSLGDFLARACCAPSAIRLDPELGNPFESYLYFTVCWYFGGTLPTFNVKLRNNFYFTFSLFLKKICSGDPRLGGKSFCFGFWSLVRWTCLNPSLLSANGLGSRTEHLRKLWKGPQTVKFPAGLWELIKAPWALSLFFFFKWAETSDI